MPRSLVRAVCLVVGTGGLVGCADPEPPGPRLVAAAQTSILEQSDAIEGRDGGQSARLWDASVWIYGDTVLRVPDARGQTWHHNSVSWTVDDDASDGITGFREPLDAAGAPDYLVAPTADEQAFNDAHAGDDCAQTPCGARWAAWPGAPVWDAARQRALVFYGLVYAEPGDHAFEGRGGSIGVWNDMSAAVQRPEVAPGTEHPTILFGVDDPSIGTAAVIDGDLLYSLACDQDGFDHVCRLARVGLDDALSRAAWQMWDGDDWTDDLDDGAVLFVGAPIVSLSRNAALGGWLVVYTPPFDREILARTAPELVGPWSAPTVIHRAPADDDAPYDAMHHPELEQDEGRVQYVTYSRHTTGWFGTEFPVVRVELAPAQP